MRLTIKAERRPEGGWIAEVAELAWVVGHGVSREAAICRAEQLAVEEIAERIGNGELSQTALDVAFVVDSPGPTAARRPGLAFFFRYLHAFPLPVFGKRT